MGDDARSEAAEAIGEILRRADRGSSNQRLERPFNFCQQEDREEYQRLLKAGKRLDPDFERRISHTQDYRNYEKTGKFRDEAKLAVFESENDCDDDENDYSRHQDGKTFSRTSVDRQAVGMALALAFILVAIAFVVAFLAVLNRNPFSSSCARIFNDKQK